MNAPTIIGAIIGLAILVAIIARGVYNQKRHKGGCSCGCDCGGCGMCHTHR